MTSTLIANTQKKISSNVDDRIRLVGLGRNEILLNLENFGKRSLYEVRDVVASFSLKLGEDINRDLYFEQRKKKEETEVSEVVG